MSRRASASTWRRTGIHVSALAVGGESCVANEVSAIVSKKTCARWRIEGEYARLSCVVLRTFTVAVRDVRDVEHSIEVTAETLYEAIATALAALQKDNWVGEIGQGFATVTVLVQQPPVKHEVKMKDFVPQWSPQNRPMVVRAKPANGRRPGTQLFYPATCCGGKSIFVRQLRGPHLSTWP